MCELARGLYRVSLFLLPPGKPLLLQTMNSATPPHCYMFTFPPSLGRDGRFFFQGDEGPQTNAETPPQFFQQLSSRNGITARKFEDPVDYFGTELLLLSLFLFDMFLLFTLLQLRENYNECTCILLIYLIKQ